MLGKNIFFSLGQSFIATKYNTHLDMGKFTFDEDFRLLPDS